ncbi:MAG: Stk1 family PASTA domain-containing Ser/Thr kinase [Actinobacteria bacterium]|nr:Stk1 family PASTA domain-containing Ser/Thr kinase [Actinomycetota bacterium]
MIREVFGNRYQIVSKLGSGGMAEVYKAEDLTLNRPVAIKILHREFADDEGFINRFRREAQAAANLNHPNIVNIYDWGSENSTYFIVMEYLKGRSLKEAIQEEGPFSPDRAIEVAKHVLSALQFAHRNNIVHRDIKPHNIILTAEGEVKVTDFGIARSTSSTMTQTGTVLGTAHYLSPEQAQGRDIGITSDIYSLGVVLYEMVTGRVPFEGENPVAIAIKHVSDLPSAPSEINPAVPASLESVILRAMSKNAANRYQSALEMRDDLMRAAAGHTVAGLPPVEEETDIITPPREVLPPEPEPREHRGRWWLWSALLLLSLLVAARGGWALYKASMPPPPVKVLVPDIEGKPLDEAREILSALKLKLEQVDTSYSDNIEADCIISQEPKANAEIEEGGTILVVVSKGKELLSIPDVVGEMQVTAVALLMRAGFEPGDIKEQYDDLIEPGRVIDQSPKPGTKSSKGTSVNLIISKGYQPVQVPDLFGKKLEDAKTALAGLGLEAAASEEFSDQEKGKVIRQAPGAGVTVAKGTKVTVVVSKGPELVTVPNLYGKTEDEAVEILVELGFLVDVDEVPGVPEAGKVYGQDPEANAKVKKGSTVIIFVGKSP